MFPMRRPRAAALATAIVLAGCRAVLGIDEDRPILAESDAAESRDGASGPSADGAASPDGSQVGKDAGSLEGGIEGGVVAADRRFALYPLPPADAETTGYAIGSDTAKDLTTGLEWERGGIPQLMQTWAAARDRCEGLTLAGASDWRVPTRIEVLTILDYVRFPTQVDIPTFWPGVGAVGSMWTASVTAAGARYTVDWKTLRVGTTGDATQNLASLCVRGGPETSPAARYEIDSAVARDVRTGLVWERGAPSTAMTQADAAKRCADFGLALDGKTWRLPDVRELVSLIDETRSNGPLVDPIFSVASSPVYWSATPGDQNVGALAVDFGSADVVGFPTAVTVSVRCVRK